MDKNKVEEEINGFKNNETYWVRKLWGLNEAYFNRVFKRVYENNEVEKKSMLLSSFIIVLLNIRETRWEKCFFISKPNNLLDIVGKGLIYKDLNEKEVTNLLNQTYFIAVCIYYNLEENNYELRNQNRMKNIDIQFLLEELNQAKYERNMAELGIKYTTKQKKIKRSHKKINIEDVRHLIDTGEKTVTGIAKKLNVSRPTVYRCLNENKIKVNLLAKSVNSVKYNSTK